MITGMFHFMVLLLEIDLSGLTMRSWHHSQVRDWQVMLARFWGPDRVTEIYIYIYICFSHICYFFRNSLEQIITSFSVLFKLCFIAKYLYNIFYYVFPLSQLLFFDIFPTSLSTKLYVCSSFYLKKTSKMRNMHTHTHT